VTLTTGPASAAVITGRREALRAALVNLALNAIDATGSGGHVTLAAEMADGRITLAVEDDGPGPPPELGAALAEPFVTGKQEGVGLGLAVARAVAEQHGGTLAWRRADGRTRFTIALAGAIPAAARAHPEPVA
jgi:signal transduction histidine kinase